MIVDNDLHIHSRLSRCSRDPEQTAAAILQYAKDNGLKTICLTDHFWDEALPCPSNWYATQNYAHILQAKPLPQAEGIRFLFGCETDMDKDLRIGVSPEKYDLFDFIIIATTHFHMKSLSGFTQETTTAERVDLWLKRLEALLSANLPFHKVGIAHLTCRLIAPTEEEMLAVLEALPEAELQRLFTKAAQLGAGIELNASDMVFPEEEQETILRIYRIAKDCGCKFYFGSDAHHPAELEAVKAVFQKAAELLQLTEADKFLLGGTL